MPIVWLGQGPSQHMQVRAEWCDAISSMELCIAPICCECVCRCVTQFSIFWRTWSPSACIVNNIVISLAIQSALQDAVGRWSKRVFVATCRCLDRNRL